MLTDKQERFCEEYLIDLNATQAAIRAGYSKGTAMEQGYQLLQKTSVLKYIKELQDKRSERVEITADMVVKELAAIGFANITDFIVIKDEIHEMPVEAELNDEDWDDEDSQQPSSVKHVYRSVEIFKTDDMPKDKIPAICAIKQGRNGIELKLNDKVKALEMLGRHLGIFAEDNKQRPTGYHLIIDGNDKNS